MNDEQMRGRPALDGRGCVGLVSGTYEIQLFLLDDPVFICQRCALHQETHCSNAVGKRTDSEQFAALMAPQ